MAAFAAVYIFWGSTYLAIKYAIETLPPFLMAGARFVFAGSILLVWARFSADYEKPKAAHWKTSFIVGTLLLLGGNGGVVFAEHYISSSLAALARRNRAFLDCAFKLALAERRASEFESRARHRRRIFRRLAFNQRAKRERRGERFRLDADFRRDYRYRVGGFRGRLARFTVCARPFRNRRLQTAGMQMFAGGLVLLFVSLIAGEWSKFSIARSFRKFVVRTRLFNSFRLADRIYGLQLAFEKRAAGDGRHLRLRQSDYRRLFGLADRGRIFYGTNARRRGRDCRLGRFDNFA